MADKKLIEKFNGTIKSILFEDPNSGYTIALLDVGQNETVKIKGTLPGIKVGNAVSCTGEYEEYKSGRNTAKEMQFKVSEYEFLEIDSFEDEDALEAIKLYLKENITKGITDGFSTAMENNVAELIVAKFGTQTYKVLSQTPEKLYEIPNIKQKLQNNVINNWTKQMQMTKLVTFMMEHNLDLTLANKIHAVHGFNSIAMISRNPYKLSEIDGISWDKADNIGKQMGKPKNDPLRIKYAILTKLRKNEKEGNCCVNLTAFKRTMTNMLNKPYKTNDDVQDADLENVINDMIKRKQLVNDNGNIYLADMHQAETNVVSNITRLMDASENIKYPTKNLASRIHAKTGIDYDDTQISAIERALNSKFSILTGGPGTGKTTTTNGILTALEAAGANVLLAAPTGRAANKLKDATGKDAMTIHRLIGASSEDTYSKNKENQLEGDVLIIDESSMIDTKLMSHLLDAVPDNMKIIMIGDEDQLPSVGAGNILHDMLKADILPVSKLTKVYRQAEESMIVQNAHRVGKGEAMINKEGSDCIYIPLDDPKAISDKVIEYVTEYLPEKYGINPEDIQVLSPINQNGKKTKIETGTISLNEKLQAKLNPDAGYVTYGTTKFKQGDKIIQTVNDYENKVMNGDIGYITSIDKDSKTVTAEFGDNVVEYTNDDMKNISPAYAITVHKAQGSEFPIVVIPLSMEQNPALNRNMLYTAMTRGKQVCVFIGEQEAIDTAIATQKALNRNTGLATKLTNLKTTVNAQVQQQRGAEADAELGLSDGTDTTNDYEIK